MDVQKENRKLLFSKLFKISENARSFQKFKLEKVIVSTILWGGGVRIIIIWVDMSNYLIVLLDLQYFSFAIFSQDKELGYLCNQWISNIMVHEKSSSQHNSVSVFVLYSFVIWKTPESEMGSLCFQRGDMCLTVILGITSFSMKSCLPRLWLPRYLIPSICLLVWYCWRVVEDTIFQEAYWEHQNARLN